MVVWLAVCYIIVTMLLVIVIAVVTSIMRQRWYGTMLLNDNQETLINSNTPLDERELVLLRTQSEVTIVKSESTCVICFEDFGAGDHVITLPGCQHQYHSACISHWLTLKPQCPYCNNNVRVALPQTSS